MNSEIPLPQHLQENLRNFRAKVRTVKLVEGILASVFGLLFSYCVLFGVDRLMDTPGHIRLIILLLGVVGFAIYLPNQIHQWFWRLRQLTRVAKVIRKSMPRFGDQLLGIIELAQGDHRFASETLIDAALKQVDEETQHRDLSPAVPGTRSKLWVTLSLPFVAATVALATLAPEAAWNALLRWSQPLGDTPRYTFAQIQPLPEKKVVAFAEPFTVEVALNPLSRHKPTSAEAQYADQRPLTVEVKDNKFVFEVPAQRNAADLVITVGDDQAAIAIEPTIRPEITSLQAKVKLPEYLQYENQQTHEARSGSLSLLKGSQYQLVAQLSRSPKVASINEQAATIEENTFVSSWVTPEGNSQLTLDWKDQYGLAPKEPFQLTLNLTDDEAPSILIRDVKREQFLLTTETLPLNLSASDDYGIQKVGLEWAGVHDPLENPEPHKGEKLAKMGDPQARTLDVRTTFNPNNLNISPQTVRLRAYVEDYVTFPRRIYSPPIVLHILNPEQHALRITELYSKWQRNALEIYERERQLNDRNKALRAMNEEQLANPDTQRNIADQARAEEQNARRLKEHTESGEELLQQATRNPNFEGDQLEQWAETLQTLGDIAENRMPSVADLLQKASDEAGKSKPGEGSEPGKQSKPSEAGEAEESSKEQAPIAINDNSNQSGKPKAEESENKPFPSIKDIESSLADNETPETSQQNAGKSPPRLTLPTTTIAGNSDQEEEPQQEPEGSPNEALNEANEEQEELLKEFAKVTDKLNNILRDLEGSTFVKRLKAASREQLRIATQLNNQAVDAFGIEEPKRPDDVAEVSMALAGKQESQGRVLKTFLEDLDAYAARVGEPLYENILDQMQDHTIQPQLNKIAVILKNDNQSGNSISASEYWADQFDIWADQLVKANDAACKAKPGKKNSASLPPELILAVMRVLREEVDLREDTRAVEQTREALEPEQFAEQVLPLQEKQYELAARTKGVVEAILKLPDARRQFKNELGLLHKVSQVMFEAVDILGEPETGPRAIGAETEAIELLLQAKRACGKGGGGGGGSSPGGGGTGTTNNSALAMLGEGKESKAKIQKRKVGQATGSAGAVLPAEFKTGLDAYFHALENL